MAEIQRVDHAHGKDGVVVAVLVTFDDLTQQQFTRDEYLKFSGLSDSEYFDKYEHPFQQQVLEAKEDSENG